jgi:hypothetical protein
MEEVATIIKPFLKSGELSQGTSSIASDMSCERMGIRGREDQQIRWRPDLYLERLETGHDRANIKMGAEIVLRALAGLRSFQQLAVQPGQQLNPAQRYWLDKALALVKEHVNGGEGD